MKMLRAYKFSGFRLNWAEYNDKPVKRGETLLNLEISIGIEIEFIRMKNLFP